MKLVDKRDCTGCMNCMNVCNTCAITFTRDEVDNIYPTIDFSKCIECGQCKRACPQLKDDTELFLDEIREAYVGWSCDSRVRKHGASGGIATAVSIYFDKNGGGVEWSCY